jgi:hypothetical protein
MDRLGDLRRLAQSLHHVGESVLVEGLVVTSGPEASSVRVNSISIESWIRIEIELKRAVDERATNWRTTVFKTCRGAVLSRPRWVRFRSIPATSEIRKAVRSDQRGGSSSVGGLSARHRL